MSDFERCPKCNHAEIRTAGVDCPICFQQQRDKMHFAGNVYLQQKASEGIRGRQKPSHMYKTYTRNVAAANSYQRDDALIYEQKTLPPLRKSVLTDRISAHQYFASQRVKPLQEAGAISLHPLEAVAPPLSTTENDDAEVFFDDAPFHESKYVFVNGEVYKGATAMPENRVMYGVDSPSAAVHAAVRAAVKRSASAKAPLPDDENAVDSPTAQKSRSVSKARRGTSKEPQSKREMSPTSYRELYSSSGRCYRVVEVQNDARVTNVRKANAASSEKEGEKDAERGGGKQHRVQKDARRHMKGGENEDEELGSKGGAVPQRPTKPREERSRPERGGGRRSKKSHSSPLRDREDASRDSPRSRGKDKRRERLPRIEKKHGRRSRSASPEADFNEDVGNVRSKTDGGKSRAVECKRRHIDSAESDAVLSSYSVSPREDEYSTVGSNHRGRHVSDCVVVEASSRPKHRPRRKRAERRSRRGHRPSSRLSNSFSSGEIDDRQRHVKHHKHVVSSDTDSEWSDAPESSSWSDDLDEFSSSQSVSLSGSTSESSASSDERPSAERRKRHIRHHGRGKHRDERRTSVSSASTSSTASDDEAAKRRRGAKQRGARNAKRRNRQKEEARHSRRSSPREPSRLHSASTTIPSPFSDSGVERPHHSRRASPPRPPLVRAVLPPIPTGVLPPLAEEMLPSTRYAPTCPSPVAHMPQPSSAQAGLAPIAVPTVGEAKFAEDEKRVGVAAECVSPALVQARAKEDAAAGNPMRRAFDEMPSEPLQLTRFNDLRPPSASSSGPLCSPSQGMLGANAQNQKSALTTATGAPMDLNYITDHVLRVIRERLDGFNGAAHSSEPSMEQHQKLLKQRQEEEEAAARSRNRALQEAEERRLEDERAAELQRQRAELMQLRHLLREAKEELRLFKQEHVPQDSLSSSLQFAFAQVSRFLEEESMLLGVDDATDSTGQQSTMGGDSGTLIYTDADKKFLESLDEGGNAAAVAAGLSNRGIDMVTVERLLKEMRDCRGHHAVHMRELREAEERRAAEAQRRQAIVALLAQETAARAATRAEEKAAFDQLKVNAAKSEDSSRQRAAAAQAAQFEDERVDLAEEELDARAVLAAMEAESAEDFWDVASRLWQAAADEAAEAERERQEAAAEQEASRLKAAAWQAAQAEEAARLQAEIQQMEAAARQRQESRGTDSDSDTSRMRNGGMQRGTGKGRLVRSNLIPGQILDVSETDGKVRLVGDPHIAAVEARARERRRADRQRQERLASAMSRTPTTKSDRSATAAEERRVLPRQPSTIRINVAGSGVAKKAAGQGLSRASSRRSIGSSRNRNSASGGNGRVGVSDRSDIPSSRGRLQSRSNFETQGDLDLGVDGQRVGAPAKTRSRASSLASAGVPLMGGIFNSATPHKSRVDDSEMDGLTSLSMIGAEY